MNKKHELIANIILILTGIIGGTIFFFINAQKLCSIFFAMALASILYQFLGGIGDNNSIKLGVIKFGGSAAVLLGFIYFLHSNIFLMREVEEDKILYSEDKWIPINSETGKTLSPPLTVENGNQTDTFPESNLGEKRRSHTFKIKENKDGNFIIYTPDFTENVGYFELTDITSTSLYDNVIIDNNETNVQIFVLKPDIANLSSTKFIKSLNLPFEIKVFNESRFSISINNKPLKDFKNREVVSKTSYIIPISENEMYVVFLEQASNYISDKYPERYSKWLVKKLKKTFANN